MFIESKGTVRVRVLINLLDCMDFKLTDNEVQKIKEFHTVNNFQAGGKAQVLVRYREVLNALVFQGDQWVVREGGLNFAEIV